MLPNERMGPTGASPGHLEDLGLSRLAPATHAPAFYERTWNQRRDLRDEAAESEDVAGL